MALLSLQNFGRRTSLHLDGPVPELLNLHIPSQNASLIAGSPLYHNVNLPYLLQLLFHIFRLQGLHVQSLQ